MFNNKQELRAIIVTNMPTHYLSITTPMVCGGCTSTVEGALKAVEGVTAVSVSLQSKVAKIETSSDEIACTCAKTVDGTCPCGTSCKCMEAKLLKAISDVGFEGKTTTEASFKCGGASAAAGPCGAANCTCGPNCQCGTGGCQCAGCPGKACGGSSGASPCGKWLCSCGAKCQCGPNCMCASCNGMSDLGVKVALGAALFAVGWMAATKFGKK